MIKNGKYFLPPAKDNSNIKELFNHLTSTGAGRPVDNDGFPQGPWTADLLANAISSIDANGSGVELRTVQLWFQDNEKGISSDNIRWLARVFGCDDPDATSQWQVAFSLANRRLLEKRKADKKIARPSRQVLQNIKPGTQSMAAQVVPTNESTWHFDLAKKTEVLFYNQSTLGLPVVVFTAAAALGLIAFNLNIHSVVYTPEHDQAKQVGFLWAPNWTIVFLAILPMYLALSIRSLRCWKNDLRLRLLTLCEPTIPLANWESRVASASYSFWAVLFITVVIASGYNWTATHLIPLLSGDPGGWPVDWGRIAILRPDIISLQSAVVFTGLVFLYNAFCSYLFFTGLIFLNVMVHDYLDVMRKLQSRVMDRYQHDIEEICLYLITAIFQCTSLGMLITIMMKLQSSFLQSESVTIVDWLSADIQSFFYVDGSTDGNDMGLRSAPGHFYSFFSMLAIFGTFVNSSVRMRLALTRLRPSSADPTFNIPWVAMSGTMILLVVNYLLIGSVTGFAIFLFFSLLVAFYLIVRPAFGQSTAIFGI